MKIFSADQIREWDKFTIEHEAIHSIELMERAANSSSEFLQEHFEGAVFIVFAGPGNNGGDGLAIARQLRQKSADVSVFHLADSELSPDCSINLDRLKPFGIPYKKVNNLEDLPEPGYNVVVIDAILGTGQNRALTGLYADVVERINQWDVLRVAIDLPTGLFADRSSEGNTVIRARYTLSFQTPKLCFFIPENEEFVGDWKLLDIGLSTEYYENTDTIHELTEFENVLDMLKPRTKFAHKGNFGTALMLGGSKGMMGAAVLAARACLRSGVGKLICRVPGAGLELMQQSATEAICSVDKNEDFLANLPNSLENYTAIGIGPGLGQEKYTRELLRKLMDHRTCPLILDADALNIIAAENWQELIPPGSVITPHIGEFTRLFGPSENHFERIERAKALSTSMGIFILVKGQYSYLSTPTGRGFFNSTGNPGMAKAGSGDVLTGMLTAFIAQQYSVSEACRVAVYLHGMAADEAEKQHSEYGIIASDLIEKIGFCIRKFFKN